MFLARNLISLRKLALLVKDTTDMSSLVILGLLYITDHQLIIMSYVL